MGAGGAPGGVREFELKARLEGDPGALRGRLLAAGWRCRFRGEMADRRLDTPGRDLERRDEVLRLRRYLSREGEARTILGWKGPASREGGFKLREEVETPVAGEEEVRKILSRLGYSEVTLAIDRRVEVYEKDAVTVRIEEYPRMDVLVEIEGEPDRVERCLDELGLPREAWHPWTLDEFVRRYEERTGERALLDRETEKRPGARP